MKLAILNLTYGGISGGYKKYLENILPRLSELPQVSEMLVSIPDTINTTEWEQKLPYINWVRFKPAFLLKSRLGSIIKKVRAFHPDIVFIPIATHIKINHIPTVNMLQNMEIFTPNIKYNTLSERARQWYQRVEATRSLNKSDRIIAISGFVQDFLEQKLHISGKKIGLVKYGIGLSKDTETDRPGQIPEGRNYKFLFTAGSIRPARGLEDILNATKLLSDQSFDIPVLVIAGETINRMVNYKKKLEEFVNDNGLVSKVLWAGTLNSREMSWCYNNCTAFIMTSRVESFGMIAGEAMSHGCISISSDSPCLPEIFGDAAIYYQSGNSRELANSIKTVLSWDSKKYEKASKSAKTRASGFSWDICADRTVTELEKAVEDFRHK